MKKILFILLTFFLSSLNGLNSSLETTTYDYSNSKIPSSFEGFRIVQISDFHLKEFGEKEEILISAVKECQPDIIVITGDLIDENHTTLSPLVDLLNGIYKLAPIYYISGNHEFAPDAALHYQNMLALFEEYQVINLDDSQTFLYRNGEKICLTGSMWRSKWVVEHLPFADQDYFNILLYHGSNYFPLLSNFGYDLLFAGHIHGGVIRLPFLGGLFSNEGSLFPKYDAGVFTSGSFTMISSRGLGDSRIPRFNNCPELVCVILHHK